MEPSHAQSKLEMSSTDDVQDMAGQSFRAAARPAGAVAQGFLVMAAPGGPPAAEGGIGNPCRLAEAAGAELWVVAACILKRGDVGSSCLNGLRCASFVHIGPPVGFGLVFC